ncbi:MAG: DegV family protein [Firmicutes bacterium]|nr:DegV family protein [Bacillota bacterium]
MNIIVTTDSTSDLPKELVEKYNIGVMPLNVNLGDDTFEDGIDIGPEKIFNYVDTTGILPKTGARSALAYQEFFEKQMKDLNADALIHISLSSELSSSHENALMASQELQNVKVLDSMSLSTGCALLVLSAIDKINEGKDLRTIYLELQEERNRVQASFVINNLKYLYKGGRCSALAMFGANVLRIKPKIKLASGKMIVDKKYMGKYEQVLINYVKDLLKDYQNVDKKRVFITFTTKNDEINAQIEQILKDYGFEEIIQNYAGSTIASHCGRDTLGVLFITL